MKIKSFSLIGFCILLSACSGGSGTTSLVSAGGGPTLSSAHTRQAIVLKQPHIIPSSFKTADETTSTYVPKYFFFGDANKIKNVHSGDDDSKTAVQVTTTGQGFPASSFGGIDFPFIAGTALSSLNTLSTDLQMSFGNCVDGTPRFGASMGANDTQNIFFYLSCSQSATWANTGNIACPTCLVDDSQLPGGTFYDTYANAQSKYGTMPIQDFFVVMDTSDVNGQTAEFDNIVINSTRITFETR